jgi:glycosyltransferase involved in cell wall biosynthesis
MPEPSTPPLVSVLLPAFNHADYVREAVESVLAQTCRDLELLVIDDASTDATWSVLQSCADPRLRLRRHDANLGSHATLNELLGLARGSFIAIINSDDVFHPGRLAACIETLQATQADLVGTDITLIDEAGRPLAAHWWITAFAGLKQTWADTQDWAAALMEGNVFMTTANFCFRRSWLDAVGEFENLRYVLDYEWLLRGLAMGRTLAWLDTPLLSYRLHAQNTIAERPLAANLECAAMLRKAFPALLAANDIDRTRLARLASQWARIETYLGEIEASRRHEALVAKEAELFALIRDRERWIAERDGWIGERDRQIAERDRWISDRDHWIAERDGWIGERDRLIAERDARIAACEAEKSAILDSRSFRLGRRLTAPARWLRRLVGGRSGRA